MAWNGSMNSNSSVNTSITFTPSSLSEGSYEVTTFTAPIKGVYQFRLKGSGGTVGCTDATSSGALGSSIVAGGSGGSTTGYLFLEKGQTVYVGAGGTCSAAFVAKANGSKLSSISASNLYFVAGGGGAAGRSYSGANYVHNAFKGGNGGGSSGAAGEAGGGALLGRDYSGGGGGTQNSGGVHVTVRDCANGNDGSYGTGGAGVAHTPQYKNVYAWSGRGGDGYYGGASGHAIASHEDATGYTHSYGFGGGGGSGYVHNSTLIVNAGTSRQQTFTSTTSQGGGAASNNRGSVTVTYWSQSELPVIFNGVRLMQLYFNGVDIKSLYINGEQLY